MVEDIFNWDVLVRESEDRLAGALHEDYWKRRHAEGVKDSENPHWEELDHEDLRNRIDVPPTAFPSNCASGYRSETIRLGQEPFDRFDEKDTLLLAQLEHARWCAERWLAGWEHTRSPIAPEAEQEPGSLGPATPEEQTKGPEQIQAISRAPLGFSPGIYR